MGVRLVKDLEPAIEFPEMSKIGIFGDVSSESVWGLLQYCSVLEEQPGAVVLSPEHTTRRMLCILEGAVRVHLSPASDPVATFGPGHTVGELSVIDSRAASAWVVVAEPTRLLVIDEDTFWRLVVASHAFATNLLRLLAQRLRSNNQQLSDTVQQSRLFERQASTDGLTGLFNRRWLDESLPRFVRREQWAKRPLSVLLLDVDHFKAFNDTHGHLAGDAALAWVAQVLTRSLRPTDFAARYGGEEFVVILPATAAHDARFVAERLRGAIAAALLPETQLRVTVSVGVASTTDSEPLDAMDLLKLADRHLYRAKARGRNRVEGPGHSLPPSCPPSR